MWTDWAAHAWEDYELKAGFYWTRLVSRGPKVPVELFYGPPRDPDTGELMDRAPRWQATAHGYPIEVSAVAPWCLKNPLSEDEFDLMMGARDE